MLDFKHSEDVAGVIDRCQELINEYQKYELLPDRLKYIEKKLAGYFTFLIRHKAKAQAHMNTYYWIRKIEHSRQSIKYRKTSSSQVQADHMANENIQKQVDDETHSVWLYEDLNGFTRAMEKIFVSIAHQLKSYEQDKINSNK